MKKRRSELSSSHSGLRSDHKPKSNTRRKDTSRRVPVLGKLFSQASGKEQHQGRGLLPPFSFLRLLGWLGGAFATVVIVSMLSMGFTTGFRWLTTSPYFTLETVQVQGLMRLSTQEVMEYAQIEPDTNILELKIADIEARLRRQLWIRSVSVRRVLPDTLQITVQEHKPRYWLQIAEKLFYVTARGEHIAQVGPQNFVSLPLLRVETGAWERMGMLEKQLELLDTVGLPVRMAEAVHIDVRAEAVRISFAEKPLQLTVSFRDFTNNIHRLAQVWKDLEWRGEHGQVREIAVFGEKAWIRS